jgi:seryl-tRNA(Sec) selenium transferase
MRTDEKAAALRLSCCSRTERAVVGRLVAMSHEDLHHKYPLTPVINAAGSFTPLGVSRSSRHVAQSAAKALGSFFIMEELQQLASQRLASWAGCEAGAVTHCASAAITLAVAASISGTDEAAVASLPDARRAWHWPTI